MRALIHLSDLHFGSARKDLLEPLIDVVQQIKPHLIAVSGDLTQRARPQQFRAARALLDRLPAPRIVVPGNHDIPLYNVFGRLRGLAAYRHYVSPELEPFYRDEEIALLGINTARALAWKGGRINREQADHAVSLFAGIPASVPKIVVSHHPFDLPETYRSRALVGRAQMAIRRLNKSKIDFYLAGHYHVGSAAPTAFQISLKGYSSVIVQAGTALSDRTRGEPNTFNTIRIDLPRMSLERYEWDERRRAFLIRETLCFLRGPVGWLRN